MIEVLIGTDAMVEHHRTAVSADDHTVDSLRVLAERSGVDTSDNPNKSLLAARLSAVTTKTPVEGSRVLTCRFPDDMPLMEIANTVTISKGIWDSWTPGALADSPPPLWVASDNLALQGLLAAHFGCAEGAPADLEDTHYTENGPAGVGPDTEAIA